MTYSIIVREGNKLGVLVASPNPNVWERVPLVTKNGIMILQALSSKQLLIKFFKKFVRGGLTSLLEELERDPFKEHRQLALMFVKDPPFAYTGKRVLLSETYVGENIVCIGNGLRGSLRGACKLRGNLLERLLKAFYVVERSGGNVPSTKSLFLEIPGEVRYETNNPARLLSTLARADGR